MNIFSPKAEVIFGDTISFGTFNNVSDAHTYLVDPTIFCSEHSYSMSFLKDITIMNDNVYLYDAND